MSSLAGQQLQGVKRDLVPIQHHLECVSYHKVFTHTAHMRGMLACWLDSKIARWHAGDMPLEDECHQQNQTVETSSDRFGSGSSGGAKQPPAPDGAICPAHPIDLNLEEIAELNFDNTSYRTESPLGPPQAVVSVLLPTEGGERCCINGSGLVEHLPKQTQTTCTTAVGCLAGPASPSRHDMSPGMYCQVCNTHIEIEHHLHAIADDAGKVYNSTAGSSLAEAQAQQPPSLHQWRAEMGLATDEAADDERRLLRTELNIVNRKLVSSG